MHFKHSERDSSLFAGWPSSTEEYTIVYIPTRTYKFLQLMNIYRIPSVCSEFVIDQCKVVNHVFCGVSINAPWTIICISIFYSDHFLVPHFVPCPNQFDTTFHLTTFLHES